MASFMLVRFLLEVLRLIQIFMIQMQFAKRKLSTKDNLLEILVQNQQDDIMLDSVEQENYILHQNQNINCLDQPNYAGTGGNNFIFYHSLNNLDTSLNNEQRRTAPCDGYLETMGTTQQPPMPQNRGRYEARQSKTNAVDRQLMSFFNNSLVLVNTKITEKTKKATSQVKWFYICVKVVIGLFFAYILYSYFSIVYQDFV